MSDSLIRNKLNRGICRHWTSRVGAGGESRLIVTVISVAGKGRLMK